MARVRKESSFSQGVKPPEKEAQILFSIGKIYFTSYNPLSEQTDPTPCHAGGTRANLCELKNTIRPIALSQDLLAWTGRGKIKAGQVVILKSELNDSRCNGEFVVLDGMPIRHFRRGDIFFMKRSENLDCVATVSVTDKIITFTKY